jgi:hypothetical protein
MISALFPVSDWGMRGLKERFYEVNPFADNANPTPKEIENWNIEVIRHFRKLLGLGDSNPVDNSTSMYLRATYATERKFSRYWDTKYAGDNNSAFGPCAPPSTNAHCGSTFAPDYDDQRPYVTSTILHSTAIPGQSSAEQVAGINADIPWGIKMSKLIATYLRQDGVGGHTGSFIRRPLFGIAYYVNGNDVTIRTKWTGNQGPACPP